MSPPKNSKQQQVQRFFNTSVIIPVHNAETTIRVALEPEAGGKRDAQAFVMGNLEAYDFDLPKALDSPEAKKIKKFIAAGKCSHAQEAVREWLFFAISASDSDFNPQNTQCIPAVKIFAFLDLAKNFSFSDSLPGKKRLQRAMKSSMVRNVSALSLILMPL